MHSMIPKIERYTDTLKQAKNMNAYGRKGYERKFRSKCDVASDRLNCYFSLIQRYFCIFIHKSFFKRHKYFHW